jgi:hypothetical protein
MIAATPIKSRFEEFDLPSSSRMDAVAVIPTERGSHLLKGQQHSYYFLNFRTAKGLRVDISHIDILRRGWSRLIRNMSGAAARPSVWRCLFRRYHYDFNLLEQLLLMTIPHTVTDLGDGRYAINLWSWFGYLLVDCRSRSVAWHGLDNDGDHVLGSAQWFDPLARELYGMSYSLADSFARIGDPARPVSCRIFAEHLDSGAEREIWSGDAADYLHELVLSPNRRFCVTCELGMYRDDQGNTIPSKVLILDLANRTDWMLERFIVAAHAQFDPDESDVAYFSNHNFQFEHSTLLQLMKRGTYAVKFRGPASVFKYRLTPEGPREIGVFTRSDFYRLTNMHIFRHRGRKLIAAMGFPDEVFLIDTEQMEFVRKIQVKARHAGQPAMVGTIAPSPDGERLLAHTTDAFHVIDIASGEPELILNHDGYHTCSNHMLASAATAWQ